MQYHLVSIMIWLLGWVLVQGCGRVGFGYTDRPCVDNTGCIEGFACHPLTGQCVRTVSYGCDTGACPSQVLSNDACLSAGIFIPCSDIAIACEDGCRTCREDLTWSECKAAGCERLGHIVDTDGDGTCDASDNDDDNDAYSDADEATCGSDPLDALSLPTDTDADGLCDAGDGDDDNDGVGDMDDPNDLNPDVCGDSDGDTCDDCLIGTDDFGVLSDTDPNGDGVDTDGDGDCDKGDSDDDNDTILDGSDNEPLNPNVCTDADGDTCDDCSVTGGPPSTSNDGTDTDGGGLCDAGDGDDDNDGVDDGTDPEPTNPDVCGLDDDGDSCDDCAGSLHDGLGPAANNDVADDGSDGDGDGVCDAGDLCPGEDDTVDRDGDGVPNGCDVWEYCDDTVDADGDGIPPPAPVSDRSWTCDCDDSDPNRYPGAMETCGDIDENCNGLVNHDQELGAYLHLAPFRGTWTGEPYTTRHVTGIPGALTPDEINGEVGGVHRLNYVYWFVIDPRIPIRVPGDYQVSYRAMKYDSTASYDFDQYVFVTDCMGGSTRYDGPVWTPAQVGENVWSWSPPVTFTVQAGPACAVTVPTLRHTDSQQKSDYYFDALRVRRKCNARSDCYDNDQGSVDYCQDGECLTQCTPTTELPLQGSANGSSCTEQSRCPDGYLATGVHLRRGDDLDRIELVCREVLTSTTLGGSEHIAAHGCGGTGSSSEYLRCTDTWDDGVVRGQIVWQNTADDWLHSTGIKCVRLSDPGTTWDVPPPASAGPYTELPHQTCPAGEQAYGLNLEANVVTERMQMICSDRTPP